MTRNSRRFYCATFVADGIYIHTHRGRGDDGRTSCFALGNCQRRYVELRYGRQKPSLLRMASGADAVALHLVALAIPQGNAARSAVVSLPRLGMDIDPIRKEGGTIEPSASDIDTCPLGAGGDQQSVAVHASINDVRPSGADIPSSDTGMSVTSNIIIDRTRVGPAVSQAGFRSLGHDCFGQSLGDDAGRAFPSPVHDRKYSLSPSQEENDSTDA